LLGYFGCSSSALGDLLPYSFQSTSLVTVKTLPEIEEAVVLTSDANISDIISQGIGPNPIENASI